MEVKFEDEVFTRFVQNCKDIKETWEISEFFEYEFDKFQNNINDYKNSIQKEQDSLKAIRVEYLKLQDLIKISKEKLLALQTKYKETSDLVEQGEARLCKLQEEQNEVKKRLEVNRESNLEFNVQIPQDSNSQILPIRALDKVDIRLKDGIVVKANPAFEVYSKEVVEKYIANVTELRALKAKLMEVEFENAKLKNALKDSKN